MYFIHETSERSHNPNLYHNRFAVNHGKLLVTTGLQQSFANWKNSKNHTLFSRFFNLCGSEHFFNIHTFSFFTHFGHTSEPKRFSISCGIYLNFCTDVWIAPSMTITILNYIYSAKYWNGFILQDRSLWTWWKFLQTKLKPYGTSYLEHNEGSPFQTPQELIMRSIVT